MNNSPVRWLTDPMPAEAMFSLPGCCLAYSTSSATVLAGRSADTASTFGTVENSATGAKSLMASYGRFLVSNGWIDCCPIVANSNVYPSAGALATKFAPMLPPPPGLFSTMTVWPSASDIRLASRRPIRLTVPPGANGTIMVMGLAG